MMQIDLDAFEERAAIMQYDGGMSQYQAETEAARAQGKSRWEVLEYAKRIGNSAIGRHHCKADARDSSNNLSGMQPNKTKQD
jgi:predicted transcriptional regulator of viral defense system